MGQLGLLFAQGISRGVPFGLIIDWLGLSGDWRIRPFDANAIFVCLAGGVIGSRRVMIGSRRVMLGLSGSGKTIFMRLIKLAADHCVVSAGGATKTAVERGCSTPTSAAIAKTARVTDMHVVPPPRKLQAIGSKISCATTAGPLLHRLPMNTPRATQRSKRPKPAMSIATPTPTTARDILT
jgi:hypothetical protein